jgi:hypothetical protein
MRTPAYDCRERVSDMHTKNPGAITNPCISWIVVTAFCDGALQLVHAWEEVYFTTMTLAPTRHSAHASSALTEGHIPTLPTNDNRSFRNRLDPIALMSIQREWKIYAMTTVKAPSGVTRIASVKAYAAKLAISPIIISAAC